MYIIVFMSYLSISGLFFRDCCALTYLATMRDIGLRRAIFACGFDSGEKFHQIERTGIREGQQNYGYSDGDSREPRGGPS